jgi:hypothetical protein
MPEPPPLEGEAKNRRPSPLNPKTPDNPKLPVLLTVNLAPSVLLPAKSEKKTRPCHVAQTHALILTNMGTFSLRMKAATIGWCHLNGQEDGQRPL